MVIGNLNFVPPSPLGVVPLREVALRLHPQDNVAIAKISLQAGTTLAVDDQDPPKAQVPVRQFIPSGHKVALREMPPGEPVRRYGQVIGFASQTISPGEHVHTQNVGVQDFAREHTFGVDVRPVTFVPESDRRTFLGYRRTDGRVGARNYIAVISIVNCSAHTSREIARYFTSERLGAFPNVDGVLAFTHQSGCPLGIGSPDHVLLQRTLAGMARHPNVAAYLIVGLGCESNQAADLIETYGLCSNDGDLSGCPPTLTIQDLGGIRKTVEAGIATIEKLLPAANTAQRTPKPISELMLALQCGGSDTWSGVTANPLLGLVTDHMVQQGGTVVLAETPEIYGAEHLLTRRAISREVGQKLLAQVHWWV